MSSIGNDTTNPRYSFGLRSEAKNIDFQEMFSAEELHNILNSPEAVELLQSAKIEQKLLNEIYEGETALTRAAQIKNVDLVSLLLEKGADIHKRNEQENTPLWAAYFKGNLAAFQLLIEKGANLKDTIPRCIIGKISYPNISLLQHIATSKKPDFQKFLENNKVKSTSIVFEKFKGTPLTKEQPPKRTTPSESFLKNKQKIGSIDSLMGSPKTKQTTPQSVPPKMPSNRKWDVVSPDPNASKNTAELKKPINTLPPVPPVAQPPSTEVTSLSKETVQFLAKEMFYGGLSFLVMSQGFPDAVSLSLNHPLLLQTAGYGLTALVLYWTSTAFFSQQNKKVLNYGSRMVCALGTATWLQLSQRNTLFLPWFVTKELGQLGVDCALRPGMSWLKGKIWGEKATLIDPNAPTPPPAPRLPLGQGN